LRELNAGGQSGFDGAAHVLELLAGLPTSEEILKNSAFRGRCLTLKPNYASSCDYGLLVTVSIVVTGYALDSGTRWLRRNRGADDRFASSAVFGAYRGEQTTQNDGLSHNPGRSQSESSAYPVCRISERFALAEHQIDHVIAVKHGGQTTAENLAGLTTTNSATAKSSD